MADATPRAPDDPTCSVCLDELTDRLDRWRPLLCEHWFHHDCLLDSLRRRPVCPLCSCRVRAILSSSTRRVIRASGSGGKPAAKRPLTISFTWGRILTVVVFVIYVVFVGYTELNGYAGQASILRGVCQQIIEANERK